MWIIMRDILEKKAHTGGLNRYTSSSVVRQLHISLKRQRMLWGIHASSYLYPKNIPTGKDLHEYVWLIGQHSARQSETDWLTDWLTDWPTKGLTDWLTWLIDWQPADWLSRRKNLLNNYNWVFLLFFFWLTDCLTDWPPDWPPNDVSSDSNVPGLRASGAKLRAIANLHCVYPLKSLRKLCLIFQKKKTCLTSGLLHASNLTLSLSFETLREIMRRASN